jgi:hypothetical protein
MVRVVVVLIIVAILCGCDQITSPVEKQENKARVETAQGQPQQQQDADPPAYDVTKQEDCSGSIPMKCYSVSTDATSEEALRRLIKDFRGENPKSHTVVVTFYPNKPHATPSGSGYAFQNEETARKVLSEMYRDPEQAAFDRQVHRVMKHGGIWVASM